MRKSYLLLVATLILISFGCQPQTSTSATSGSADSTANALAAKKDVVVKLGCREIRSMDDISPLSEIYMEVYGKKIIVDSASVCGDITPEMWETYEIPKDAKAAVGGWWAGAGDYYYLKMDGGDAVVMYGWAAEEAEEKDMYQYKEIGRTKL